MAQAGTLGYFNDRCRALFLEGTILINGQPSAFKKALEVLGKGRPLFVFRGTGGASDLVADVLEHRAGLESDGHSEPERNEWEPSPQSCYAIGTSWSDLLLPADGDERLVRPGHQGAPAVVHADAQTSGGEGVRISFAQDQQSDLPFSFSNWLSWRGRCHNRSREDWWSKALAAKGFLGGWAPHTNNPSKIPNRINRRGSPKRALAQDCC